MRFVLNCVESEGVMITRSRIAKYWLNKGINKNTFEVVELKEDTNFEEVNIVVFDWGEPDCWVCGKSVLNIQREENVSFSKVWDASRLERCHVLAKQFGGSDEPANLFLLCRKCHLESPDTRNPQNFYAWVINKRGKGGYIQGIASGLKEAIKMKGISDIEEFVKKIPEEKTILDVQGQAQIAKNVMKNCGFHGAKVVDSTIFMSLIDELMKGESID